MRLYCLSRKVTGREEKLRREYHADACLYYIRRQDVVCDVFPKRESRYLTVVKIQNNRQQPPAGARCQTPVRAVVQ
jgi:hypothetical protein